MPNIVSSDSFEPLASLSNIAIKEEALSFLWDKSIGKYNVLQSIYIPKRFLSVIRAFFAIYFLATLFIVLAYTENYSSFLQISRWGFLVQTIYFIQAASYSLKDKPSGNSDIREEHQSWKISILLYEIAFSFQFFNIIYAFYMLFSGEIFELSGVELYIELHLHIISFLVIWCEQVFNLMRLYKRHTFLVGLAAIANLAIIYFASTSGESEIYKGFSFDSWKSVILGTLMILLPILHYSVGCDHFEFKQKQKVIRRKYLRGQLIVKKKVRDNVTDDN